MKGFLRLTIQGLITMAVMSSGLVYAQDDSEFDELEQAPTATESSNKADDNFDDELDKVEEKKSTAEKPSTEEVDEFSEMEPTPSADEKVQVDIPPENPPPPETPAVEEKPVVEQPTETQGVRTLAFIKNIRYKANDNGGTLVVDADRPLTFTTRENKEMRQMVIEIPDAQLPTKLQRPFNTKDMVGSIGSIDAYQNPGSSVARIVVQLREGAAPPVVQNEGNSLLVVAGAYSEDGSMDPQSQSQILSSQSLEDFLAGNRQFYGKKISLETSEMDLKEVFKFVSEESGVNLVLADEVKGTISLKLRQVPWDQALVVIMKAKKLGYTRAGNVLRIAPLADIRGEEDEAIKIANQKKSLSPLKVRVIPVSYAKIDELRTQVEKFISERGKVVGDNRTSSLVVSDIEENIDRITRLVQSIDLAPPQVLIEGKVVEATDSFKRSIGINWGTIGRPTVAGASSRGDIRANSDISIKPGAKGESSFGLNFRMGTLDILGDLTATLSLFEKEDMVKVVSSPRIVALHNEPSVINQTSEIPLITTIAQQSNVSKTVNFKPVKLSLSVTPQITNDGSVIMLVDVNRDFVGAIVDKDTQARPVNSRSAKTKVLVKNGQTAVIGGIYQSDATEAETKVPVLGDIPIVGWLFKSKDIDKQKNELLIFLTPRILGQADSQAIPSSGGTDL